MRRDAESLVAAGYGVDVVCLRNKGQAATEIIDGVTAIRLPWQSRRVGRLWYCVDYLTFFLMALVTVSWLHLRRRYAVIEADSMPDLLVFAGVVPRLMGARLLLYLFESMPELWAQQWQLPMSHWAVKLLCWQEAVSCRFADAIVCCHEMARDALVQRGVPQEKVEVVLNVPDERVFHPGVGGARPGDGAFRMIQHGTMTEQYGIQVVLQALARLDPALPIHFDVVGKGEYRAELEALSRRLGVQDRVTIHGVVSLARLLDLLGQADAGVVPMLLEYQSPNKLFELVALGKPVIASDRRTFRQHLSGEEVLYFATGDAGDLARAIEFAYRNRGVMEAQAQRAAVRYQQYRWQRMSRRYHAVYARLFTQIAKASGS